MTAGLMQPACTLKLIEEELLQQVLQSYEPVCTD